MEKRVGRDLRRKTGEKLKFESLGTPLSICMLSLLETPSGERPSERHQPPPQGSAQHGICSSCCRLS